jgi:hypothetical protein
METGHVIVTTESAGVPYSVQRLRDLGLEILGGSPEEATQFVKHKAAMVAKFIEQGKLKPD